MSNVTPMGARFTDEQLAAIVADNHLLIEAGAGSGKTTTLVEKIVYQLGAEIAQGRRVARPCTLDQIVAITFTNAAAADLKRKLRVRLRREGARTGDARWTAMVYEVDRAPIGTIHSFCASVLRQYALRLGLDPHFVVLEEHESASLRDECAREIMMTALRDMDATAIAVTVASGLQGATDLIASLASDALRARAALDAWHHGGTARVAELATRLRDLATAWDVGEDQAVWNDTTDADATKLALWILRAGCAARELMHQRCDAMCALDFDALISRTRDALDGDSSVLAALHSRLSWVFIDEFQDTDPAQLEIGYRLCGLNMGSGAMAGVPRLCIIGDPKQSIYRFRHADVSLWGKVVQRFAALEIEPVRLTRNFRSRAPIVGLVNATFDGLIGQGRQPVLDEGHEIPFIALRAHRDTPGDDGIVEIVRIAADAKVDMQRADEAAWIVRRIQQMVRHEEIILDDDGDVAVWRKPRWSDFALLFRARTGLEIYESAFRAAGIPCVVSGGRGFFETRAVLDVQLLLAALIDPFDNLAWFGLLRSPFIGLRDETVLRFTLENRGSPLSAILDQGATAPLEADCLESGRQSIAALKALRDRVSVATLIRHALDSSGYAAQAMFRADGDSSIANLHKLARIADAQPDWSVAEFLAQMRQRAETSRSEAEAPLYTAGEDVVTLTTVHSAKGLEWSVVFLCDLRRDIDSRNIKASIYFDACAGVGTNLLGDSAAHDLLHVRERALARSEEKRLWYVAMTRARDYLVLCMPDTPSAAEGESGKSGTSAVSRPGEELVEEPKQVHEWLCRALGDTEPTYEYRGRRWTVRETIAETQTGAQHASAVDVTVERPLPTLEELDGAMPLPSGVCKHIQAVPRPATLRRRSATELMKLQRDSSGHRDAYVLGVPDRRLFTPDKHGNTPHGVPARIMGDLLHASLEEQLEDAALDEFHERELSARLDESVQSPRLQAAVRRLSAMVTIARSNPTVAALYDAPNSERELSFTWIRHVPGGAPALIHGAIDLVATLSGGEPEILDYKSHAIRAGDEEAKAAEYDLQRDLYVEALRAILGAAPRSFTFYFPETNTPITTDLSAETSEARLARIDQLLALDTAAR